jgi:hypothetical protein
MGHGRLEVVWWDEGVGLGLKQAGRCMIFGWVCEATCGMG